MTPAQRQGEICSPYAFIEAARRGLLLSGRNGREHTEQRAQRDDMEEVHGSW